MNFINIINTSGISPIDAWFRRVVIVLTAFANQNWKTIVINIDHSRNWESNLLSLNYIQMNKKMNLFARFLFSPQY